MWKLIWVDEQKIIRESFKNLKADIRSLHEELASLKKELRTLQETCSATQSQINLSLKEQKNTPCEQDGKPSERENTKAPAIFSAETKKDSLKEDLLKAYERNRKNIIKEQILSEAKKGGMTKIALRDLVVDQKKYCSKASFYRYMDELELQGLITYQRRKGKDLIQPVSINIAP